MSIDQTPEPGLEPEVKGSVSRIAPWHRRQLCRELAVGEVKRTALARKYGVSPSAITAFAKRNAAEVDAIKAQLDDQFAGLWIARKENRLAQYQADYEASEQHDKSEHFEWIRVRTQIMHQVAEELGQLPPRATLTIMPVAHVIVGVDPDALT